MLALEDVIALAGEMISAGSVVFSSTSAVVSVPVSPVVPTCSDAARSGRTLSTPKVIVRVVSSPGCSRLPRPVSRR